jgi:hypothetical protein
MHVDEVEDATGPAGEVSSDREGVFGEGRTV